MYGIDTKISKECAEAAAKWWADQISGSVKFDNGDDSMGGLFCMAMAKSLVKAVTEEQKKTFIEKLTEIILDKQYDCLYVDYHPDMSLREAALVAGISENNFPWKTGQWFVYDKETDSYRVVVRVGYGGEHEQIYPAKGCEQE